MSTVEFSPEPALGSSSQIEATFLRSVAGPRLCRIQSVLFTSAERMQPEPGLVVWLKLVWFLITLSLVSEPYII